MDHESITKAEILEALADDHFVTLFNSGAEWVLEYVPVSGEIQKISDSYLDRLLARWIEILEKLKVEEAS